MKAHSSKCLIIAPYYMKRTSLLQWCDVVCPVCYASSSVPCKVPLMALETSFAKARKDWVNLIRESVNISGRPTESTCDGLEHKWNNT